MKLTQLMARERRVRYLHARDGNLWYQVVGTTFVFPIPFAQVGTATYPAEDNVGLYLTFIRPHYTALQAEGAEIRELEAA